jgi:hypothetical protein
MATRLDNLYGKPAERLRRFHGDLRRPADTMVPRLPVITICTLVHPPEKVEFAKSAPDLAIDETARKRHALERRHR